MSRATAGGFGSSVGSLKMDNYSGDMNITGQKDYLITPLIDMNSASSNTWLRFNVAYAKYNASSNDALEIVVSTDCGVTWNSIYNKSGTVLSTAPIAAGAFTPNSSQWRTDSVNMGSFAGQSECMLMFTSISNYGNNFYVDDIFVGDITTGISEVDFENTISIYPNPVSSTLYVKTNLTFKNAEIKIINTLGEILSTYTVLPGLSNYEMDISLLNSGIYYVQIVESENTITKKIIKY